MDTTFSQSAPDITARLRMILHGLRLLMGTWGLEGQVALLLWTRTGRIFGKIERMLVRYRAGTLRTGTPRERVISEVGDRDVAGQGPAPRTAAKVVLPRKFGWLVGPGGYRAMGYRSQLVHLLQTEPEMVAMLEQFPQARRVLRPLLRALGVDELCWVPTPPRPPKPRAPRKPRPKPAPFFPPLPRGVATWARREKAKERAWEKFKATLGRA